MSYRHRLAALLSGSDIVDTHVHAKKKRDLFAIVSSSLPANLRWHCGVTPDVGEQCALIHAASFR
jgi:hypothetical protein